MAPLINAVTPLEDARRRLAQRFDLKFSAAVKTATDAIHERLKSRIPEVEWPFYAPLIFHINRLKAEQDALILAHPYQSPQIAFGVADILDDSFGLVRAAAQAGQSTLIVCGTRFLAETAKLLRPDRRVLVPDSRAGSTLANSITPEDVLALKAHYPGAPVITHIDTPVAVKAVSDLCCTTGTALDIVAAAEGDTVILVPDQYLAQNTARNTGKKLVTWAGACAVHESFTAADIAALRQAYPDARIVAHLQCRPEVVEAADFAGGTHAITAWLIAEKPARAVLVTEPALADTVAIQVPDIEILRGGTLRSQTPRITLETILWSLESGDEQIAIAPKLAEPARRSVEKMLEISGPARDRSDA